MTTITIDRATVEQAVEALEYAQQDRECPSTTRQAIAALRAALAQQDEPVQEPVAHFGSAYVNENGVHITTVLGPVAIPQDAKLYTAPPQRKPLTDATLWGMWVDSPSDVLRFARAVERAHGIKERV